MTTVLKTWGNKPEMRDELISEVSEGRRQSSISSKSGVGMGSREQVLGADFVIIMFNHYFRDRLKCAQGNTRERISLSG